MDAEPGGTIQKLVAGAAVAVLIAGVTGTTVVADPPSDGGRESRPGETQTGRKPDTRIGGPIMDPPGQIVDRGGPRGQRNAAVEEAVAAGESEDDVADARASYVRLVLDVTQDGRVEVRSATEIQGTASVSDAPSGDFIAEVLKGDVTVTAQALADPFEMRSMEPAEEGDGPRRGHFRKQLPEGTLIVDVPDATLTSEDLTRTSVRLYRIKPGEHLSEMNPAVLKQLERENRLEKKLDTKGSDLPEQARQRGKRLGAQ